MLLTVAGAIMPLHWLNSFARLATLSRMGPEG